jgi:VWFA-related protein
MFSLEGIAMALSAATPRPCQKSVRAAVRWVLAASVFVGLSGAHFRLARTALAHPRAPAAATGAQSQSEQSQQPFLLHAQRNEVLVRVLVRDRRGHAVTNLKQGDFRIFDNGKLQVITHFELQEAPEVPATAAASHSVPGAPGAAPPAVLPSRFMALFFDDMHLDFSDLVYTRDAAGRYLDANLKPGDRVAIFTASGADQLDFTDDRQKLHEALLKLRSVVWGNGPQAECPPLTTYQAYKIAELDDRYTLQMTVAEAQSMCCGPVPCPQANPNHLIDRSRGIVAQDQDYARRVLYGIEQVCRRMTLQLGQRHIVLVSPGFFAWTIQDEVEKAVEGALRSNVVIGTLDARGLYTGIQGGDASSQGLLPLPFMNQLRMEEQSVNWGVLESLSAETGGVHFENNNDFLEGFRRAGGFPEAYYMLAFAPENLKPNGRKHTLKVTLVNNRDYELQARKAYFAPKPGESATTLAQEELQQEVFSQSEVQTVPVTLDTEFFKTATDEAKLTVLVRLDVSHLRVEKQNGRNLDQLTVVTAIFNYAGDYVTGNRQDIDLRLLDHSLAHLEQTGLRLRASFLVKPGRYLVRAVVRERDRGEVSAGNTAVEIP